MTRGAQEIQQRSLRDAQQMKGDGNESFLNWLIKDTFLERKTGHRAGISPIRIGHHYHQYLGLHSPLFQTILLLLPEQ